MTSHIEPYCLPSPKLPALEAEPTNDTAALTCYALEWRQRAIDAEAISAELLETLEQALMAIAGYTHQNDITLAAQESARAAIAKARGQA